MKVEKRRTQAERSAGTQQRLLDATLTCLLELGHAGTTTREVGKRAGVSRGAQLHHYPTKARLLAAAAEHLLERRHHEFQLRVEPLADRQAIAVATNFLWSVYSGPTLKAWQELVVAARTDDALRAQLVTVNRRFFAAARETFAGLFQRQARDDAELAAVTRLILSVLDGLALNQTLEEDEQAARGVLGLLEEMALAWSRG
jgi:AcrR family transcriptional regulator